MDGSLRLSLYANTEIGVAVLESFWASRETLIHSEQMAAHRRGAPGRGHGELGYVVGGGIMIVGGLVEIVLGVDAEGKSLEQVATPLTVIDG